MNKATASIKNSHTRIETLLDGYEAQQVEPAGTVDAAEGGYDYTPLLAKLKDACRSDYFNVPALIRNIDDVLEPDQINEFLTRTVSLECESNYRQITGSFIGRLIQLSYRAGHNNFTLNLENLTVIDDLGRGLQGTEQKPIILNITGKAGNLCGAQSQYIVLNIGEAEEDFGTGAGNSKFYAEQAGDRCGVEANESEFTVQQAGESCGKLAYKSTFSAEYTGEYCGMDASSSTFKTKNPDTFKKMRQWVESYSNNKVAFILKDGTEEIRNI